MSDLKKKNGINSDSRRLTRQVSMNTLIAYNDLRLNVKLCDGTLILDNGDTFPIHRSVLSSSSDYFKTLFTTSLHEEEHTNVNLKTIESSIMELILQYIYMRQIDINYGNVLDIMKIADYLCIDGLVQLCHEFLFECLGPYNCVTLLQFAAYYYFSPLVEAAYKYIAINFMMISEQGNELMNLEKEEFKNILKNNHLNVKREEYVWDVLLKWIDNDPKNRIDDLEFLLPEVRFGLMDFKYFTEKVKNNYYIQTQANCKAHIIEVHKFLHDQQLTSNITNYAVPTFAQPRYPFEVLFAIGGWCDNLTSAVEIYDIKSNSWIQVLEEDPHGPRAYHSSIVKNNCIYVIGGYDGFEFLSSCRRFNVATKCWEDISSMNYKRCYVSAVLLNGNIYAMGGFDGHQRLRTAEKYDFERNQWTIIAPMRCCRSDFGAAVLNNKIFVVGGYDGRESMNTAEAYDADADQWTDVVPGMRQLRSGVTCVAHRGRLYALGGFDGRARTASCERYDPAAGQWTPVADMLWPRSNFAADVLDGAVFAAGGYDERALTVDRAEYYDEGADKWIQVKNLHTRRSALSTCVIQNLPNIESYMPLSSRNTLGIVKKNI